MCPQEHCYPFEAQHQMWKVSQTWQTYQIWWYRMLTLAPEMTVLYTIYWRNCTFAMLSDVFNNLEIFNTPLIFVVMLLQDNSIFKTLTRSGVIDSLAGFQNNLAQNWWPDFPTGVTGHVCVISLSNQDWRQWHRWFPTRLLLFHTAWLLCDTRPHPCTS